MTTTTQQVTIEFALMVDWEDGNPAEIIPAVNAEHAALMARTIYSARPSWTVGREVQPWRYVRVADAELTEVPALLRNEGARQ